MGVGVIMCRGEGGGSGTPGRGGGGGWKGGA